MKAVENWAAFPHRPLMPVLFPFQSHFGWQWLTFNRNKMNNAFSVLRADSIVHVRFSPRANALFDLPNASFFPTTYFCPVALNHVPSVERDHFSYRSKPRCADESSQRCDQYYELRRGTLKCSRKLALGNITTKSTLQSSHYSGNHVGS